MMLSFLLMAVSLFMLIFLTNFWILHLIVALFGLTYGGIAVSHSPIIAMLFGLRAHGLIFGVVGVAVAIGGAMGPFMTGYIFDVTETYRSAFLISGCISTVGFIMSAVLKFKRVSFIKNG
jgi:MFS family permease